MAHNFVYVSETDTDVLFQCSVCSEQLGFNKAGIGDPCTTFINGVWTLPPDCDKYASLTSCDLGI